MAEANDERTGDAAPKSFWRSSGLHLLERSPAGYLTVTPDYVRAYLARPEVAPIDESCAEERDLHAALIDDPLIAVAPDRLQRLADPDARDNYQVILAFRDRLAAAGTVEGAYLSVFLEDRAMVPPLFIDQMTHVIVHAALDGIDYAFLGRAGELLFREQVVRIDDGTILSADTESVERLARPMSDAEAMVPGGEANLNTRLTELDVLLAPTADQYWGRSDQFDFAIDLTFARPGLDALCRVLERWVRHLLSVEVRIQPVQKITDQKWVWHTGLDPESSALLNDLYNGIEVGAERMENLLSLFRLEFVDVAAMRSDLVGRPVYLGLAKDTEGRLKLKPQNLLINLPLASPPDTAAFN